VKSLFALNTRREFMGQIAGGLVVLNVAPVGAPRQPSSPTVSFFFDQPYWDPTGLDKPYVPPSGARSGQSLDDETLRRTLGWL
jgi:hypothetical protein